MRSIVRFLFLMLLVSSTPVTAADYHPTVSVFFSPNGGCTDAVVREIGAAQKQILVQAYSFTSAPIAKALIDAAKRGVIAKAILDKSNGTAKYSSATFLVNASIPTLIDDQHVIAHNKIMIIDSSTVITGSFNFTKAAEQSNAENLVILKDSPDLAHVYEQNWNAHAAHAHPSKASTQSSSSTPAQKSAGVRDATPSLATHTTTAGSIQGNINSKIYHLPGCPGYGKMKPENRVTFTSEQEAQQGGYHKAGNCR